MKNASLSPTDRTSAKALPLQLIEDLLKNQVKLTLHSSTLHPLTNSA
jgi:hypothetical protein